MFGRRNMARTNDLWEGDVHCDEKETNVARRPPPPDRSEVVFCPLARGWPANWSVRRIIFFLRRCALFLFRRDFLRTCEGRFARNSCEASVPSSERRIPLEKSYLLKLFWAGSSCRFTATLFCGFDACVSERFDLCSQPTRMWCARRPEGACQPFYCLPRCGCRCLHPFLRSCGFLTRCFGEGVAALVVHGILILGPRSGDIEREGLLPFCFICPLSLTASSTLKRSSAPQLSLSIACANSSLLPFSVAFVYFC
ncbi:hypothetical protein TCDM_10998 [Trypanosoma cruzi Dm28c]|uniref:Uncharacterized protein n=1 Tax=Trypanosoma cruzi Dm28c TaxID=1416333 RepID=V5BAJ6_TRYCR|nr:hypothetical protein TCDM_10998 [Trypanosoma cruzi Dm28c]